MDDDDDYYYYHYYYYFVFFKLTSFSLLATHTCWNAVVGTPKRPRMATATRHLTQLTNPYRGFTCSGTTVGPRRSTPPCTSPGRSRSQEKLSWQRHPWSWKDPKKIGDLRQVSDILRGENYDKS